MNIVLYLLGFLILVLIAGIVFVTQYKDINLKYDLRIQRDHRVTLIVVLILISGITASTIGIVALGALH